MKRHMALPPTADEIAFADHILLYCNCLDTCKLTADKAVDVFNRSGLSRSELREIWGLADGDENGVLEKHELLIALRVMGWVQSGEKFSKELVNKPGPRPKIRGIELPSTPKIEEAPSTPTTSASFNQHIPTFPIVLGPDIRKYRTQFLDAGPVDGILEGDAVREIYMKSDLSYGQLSGIWTLVDTERTGRLNFSQFAVGLYLIDALKSCRLPAVPSSLPPHLFEQFSDTAITAVEDDRSPFLSPEERVENTPSFPVPQPSFPLTHQRTRSRPPPVPAKSPSLPPKPPPPPKPMKKPWGILPSMKMEYDKDFSSLDVDGMGRIPEEDALRFLRRFDLPTEDLAAVWDLAAIRNDKYLDSEEFAVAMHLVNERRAGKPLPLQLPQYLVPPSLRSEASISTPSTPQTPAPPVTSPTTHSRRSSLEVGPVTANGFEQRPRPARSSISQLSGPPISETVPASPDELSRSATSKVSLTFLTENPSPKQLSRRRTTVSSSSQADDDDPFEELRQETKTLRRQVDTLLQQLSAQNDYRNANEQLRTENSELKAKISELEASMASVLRQMQSNDNALSDALTREIERLTTRVQELEQTESQLQQTTGILEVAKRDNTLLTGQIRDLRTAEATHKVELEAARHALEGLEAENTELKARLADMTKAMSEPDNANSSRELRVLLKDVTRDNMTLKGRVRELERSMEHMLLSNREGVETEQLKRENRELKMQIQELEMLAAQLQSTHEDSHLQQVLVVLTRENEGMKVRIRDMQANTAQVQQEADGRVAEMQRRLEELQRENEELRRQAAARPVPVRRDSAEDMSVPPPAYDDNMFIPAESH